MSLVTFLPLLLALGICLIPLRLLPRPGGARTQDYFVASQYTRPEVVRNASIAYALRMTAFGPLFVWGASGDLQPALTVSACLALGIGLVWLLRRPLFGSIDRALRGDRSVSVHAFIARHHGDDPRVRVFAACLTVFALSGLLAGELLAVAAFVKSMLPRSAAGVCVLASGALALTLLFAIAKGNAGVLHSAQVQLGLSYLGLFGATALLLYLQVSALSPMPPHGSLAVVFVAACAAMVLYYRRSRYVDADPIRDPASGAHGAASTLARLLSRFAKILNALLSALLVAIIAVALMYLLAADAPTIVRDSGAALRSATRIPGAGLLALALLALVYPLVDVASWQRLAALRKDAGAGVEPGRSAALRRAFGVHALESCLMGLFVCALGAIAVGAIGTRGGTDALQGLVAKLAAADDAMTAVIASLLLVCVATVALSTTSAVFSAILCTIRYDMLADGGSGQAAGAAQASDERTARRRTIVAGAALGVAVVAASCVAAASVRIDLTSGTFVALLLALCCAQLSLAPLVAGPIVTRADSGGAETVGAAWALAILACGAVGGVVAVTAYLVTGNESWLWAAVPVCLGSGFALYFIARIASRRAD